MKIIHDLQGFVSGFAVSKYVIDAPGGGGKIPLQYNHVIDKNDKEVVLENYIGKTYYYPLSRKADKDDKVLFTRRH